MGKRILLIALAFPPSGGPRGLRWVRFIRRLKSEYVFDVLTVRQEKGAGSYDRDGESSIPPEATVFRTYPGPLYKFSYRYLPTGSPTDGSRRIRSGLRRGIRNIFRTAMEVFLVPDKRIEWLPWGYSAVRRLVKERSYEAVISSAAPFSGHVLAALVRKKTGLPWIADYGDPWAFNEFSPFPLRRRVVDRRLEADLLKRMDGVVFTTRETADAYLANYPFLNPEKLTVIPAAYDEDEFSAVEPERGNGFRMVYTGIFYKDRGPEAFFESLTRLDFDFELVIAGDVPREYVESIRRMRLAGKVVFLGHCSHSRALGLQKGADVLILFGWGKGQQIPAKIFEYFGARRPVLAVRSDDEDIAAGMVESHRRGITALNRPEDIAAAIGELHELWKQGKLEHRFDLGELEEYSIGVQSERLKELIEKVISEKKPG